MSNLIRIGALASSLIADIRSWWSQVATGNRYSGFLINGAWQQVPAGYTFYITKLMINSSVANSTAIIWTATAEVTNDVPSITGGQQQTMTFNIPVANVTYEYSVFLPILENLYPAFNPSGATSKCQAFGVLIANP